MRLTGAALGLLLSSGIGLAVAAPPRFRTLVLGTVDDPAKKLTLAMVEAALAAPGGGTVVDACWQRPDALRFKVVLDRGKVASVERIGATAGATAAAPGAVESCVVQALRAVVVAGAAPGRATVTLWLDSDDAQAPTKHKLMAIGPPPGPGTGGGGQVEGDFVTGKGTVATKGGPPRKSEPESRILVGPGPIGATGPGRVPDDVDRVIRARAGLLRACYARELARTPGLQGRLVVEFDILPDGTTAAVRPNLAQTTLRSDKAIECIVSHVAKLKFPAADGKTHIVYPFVFTSA